MSTNVVTRFAPSPTGYLHIGGARTALFNWLLARQTGGKMLLRIEDTDRERSTDAAIEAIIYGMKWLGLDWDGETIYQFARAARHREVAEELLARGAAYRCYATPQELDEMRELARKESRPPRYDGRWRDLGGTQAEADAIAEGRKPVVRLKAPREGETVIEDKVQGTVTFPNKDLDDLILLRSDSTPTYMLAVVVDDHDMGVTQIVRGDDHLTNAARQTHIYQAMGWDVPAFAHIPLIHGPDGAKMSKRHGALGVDAYRALGYLPEALRNYLARLGWSQGDREFFSTDELIEAFSLAQVHRSPARFDYAKLENMNGHYMRAMDDAALLQQFLAALPYLPDGKDMAAQIDETKKRQLARAMAGLKERAKTLIELAEGARFLFARRPLAYDEKARDLLNEGGRGHLAALAPKLAALPEWTAAATEAAVRAYVAESGAKLGQVAQPLRAALTGRTTSPGIFDVLETLGREESLGRIDDAARPS
ncbi:glutamate--tRNA ligase [Rhodoblastus sp.]|uniref:glutamate--tRNA ligase n=1 Tax=Rhodoblastus sp. TaxID=1962975 RepID=UPI002624A6C4|nr:glutamate--tRNA ligase [Rhodoblastus sp.]